MTARLDQPENGRKTALAYASMLLSGLAYAWWLDASRTGRFLADKRTWMAILLGEGLIMAGLALLVPLRWLRTIFHMTTLFTAGTILRALRNEMIIQSQLEKELHGHPQTPAHLR